MRRREGLDVDTSDWGLAFLLQAYLVGWAVAVPIGPVNLEIIRRTLRRGLVFGLAIGLGATVVDLSYLLLAGFGLSRFLQIPVVLLLSFVLGGILMGWLAVSALRDARAEWRREKAAREALEKALQPAHNTSDANTRHTGVLPTFGIGVAMTALSPFTIAFWATQPSLLFGGMGVQPTTSAVLGAGAMVWLGTLSWVGLLVGLLALARKRIGPRFFALVTASGGVLMAGFALRFLYLAMGMVLGN
jgi:putative LysE/RhtB family amino acid efflux pump